MYEVEIKAELTAEEKDNLKSEFKKRGYTEKGTIPQNDYYIEANKSRYSGYDLRRYRNEADEYIYTEKVWEMVNGEPARKETEREVSKDEFDSAIAKFPEALKIIKDREWFVGSYNGLDLSITIDTVKFDHSPDTRYFVEAEVQVKDKENVQKTKDVIKNFLKEVLKKSEILESPGMFTMAFEKR